MALADWIPRLLRPSLLLGLAVYHFGMTILETIFVHREPSLLFNLSKLREKSFARIWINNGEAMSLEMPGNLDELLQTVHGTVLDVGPGSGEQLTRFDASKVDIMYGAEPGIDLHPGLLRSAEKTGFGGKYKALHCGGEPESLIPALAKASVFKDGASQGVFDEVVCVRVLCGVPRPEETIQGLYRLIKPGGRLIFCEHVINPWRDDGAILARLFQAIYALLGWKFFMGGCTVDRNTKQYLLDAAGKEGWEEVHLESVDPTTAIPFIVGYLVKRG
ncbi:S-adenosyl-L-methionine-dependent methyltransferase [Lophium mytilinum]|uniref:S-adenosyl-L-methionine-dependent methyltransferase n=1 Tax=Lophium mytilinum TaxID=390894 RepID=A0A6A6R056_9PEZI|nr:S-adenosyl-L-methionine-dependent methyltransferase [Lophium mytilinum]